ncbi:MAG: hypothetical protein D6767_10890, partial [Candidatus Hydrogenedentota bacterium]
MRSLARAIFFLLVSAVYAQQVVEVKAKKNQSDTQRETEAVSMQSSAQSFFGSATIAEILQKESGIQIRRAGPNGTYSNITLRASTPQQVNVYYNGMLINDPNGGGVNLEDFPEEFFSSALIFKDSVPVEYVSENLAGAIDLKPRAKKNGYFFYADSLESLGSGIFFSKEKVTAMASWRASRNRYLYLDRGGTVFFNQSDDTLKLRENEDFFRGNVFIHGQYKMKDTQGKTILFYTGKNRGLPGTESLPTKKTRLETSKLLFANRLSGGLGNKYYWHLQNGGYWSQNTLRDPQKELAIGFEAQTRDLLRSQNTFLVGGIFPTVSWQLPIHFGYAKMMREKKFLADRAEITPGLSLVITHIPKLYKLILEGKTLFQQEKSIYANKTYEKTYSFFSQLSLQPLWWFVKEKNTPTFYARASTSSRLPSFTERYGDGALLLPSIHLQEEKAMSYSTGIKSTCSFLGFSFSGKLEGFYSLRDNLILFVANSQKTMIALNVSKAKIYGLESEFAIQHKMFTIKTSYTYTRAADESNIP